ncbi:hypothetical protein BJY00DRAFT_310154 [Aspergillus carlsbadensis]|nr:hypothetical protein BJY00DRAFT_310154 [Aspergillus carlsbadensis]
MPVRDYGIWKGVPVQYDFEYHYEDPDSPHLSLYYHDHAAAEPEFDRAFRRRFRGRPPNRNRPMEIPGLLRAAINIKSTDRESRLAYWVDHDMADHAIVPRLSSLEYGFHPIEEAAGFNGRGLDYIRGNLFHAQGGRVLPHDMPGQNNDIIDVLEPEVKKAIDRNANIYLVGSMFNTKNGIHNVHMNQGNVEKFRKDDGVYQDGGLLIEYDDHWAGVFLAFASQAIHTHDVTGHVISDDPLTWGEFLQVGTGRRGLGVSL